MVLSTIIVGIIYFSFTTVQTYQANLASQKQSAEDVATLYYVLKKDIQQSTIVRASSKNVISCEYPLKKNVVYEFYDSYVVRHQVERVDSFSFGFEAGLYWTDTLVAKFPAAVDEVRLAASKKNTVPAALTLHKFYDAATLIPLTEKDTLK